MQNFNKSLLATLVLALLSLTAYQTGQLLSDQSQVLGDTAPVFPTKAPTSTPRPTINQPTPTISAQGIPCEIINTLQRQYCSAPTPAACKSVSITFNQNCTGTNTFKSATARCTSSHTVAVGDGTCKTADELRALADNKCLSVCYQPTSTPTYRPTSTKPPTSTPTRSY